MTVKELKEKLKEFDDNMQVKIAYSVYESIYITNTCYEDIGEVFKRENKNCVVLGGDGC